MSTIRDFQRFQYIILIVNAVYNEDMGVLLMYYTIVMYCAWDGLLLGTYNTHIILMCMQWFILCSVLLFYLYIKNYCVISDDYHKWYTIYLGIYYKYIYNV